MRRGRCWLSSASAVLPYLRDRVRVSGHLASEVEDGLWELVAGGIVTADGFDNLRSLVDPKRRRGEGRYRRTRPRHVPGRWALLREQPIGVAAAAGCGSAVPDVEPFARQLLARWGIVFRALVTRETAAPAWRDLLEVLRDLEATGAIRGGRFVEGVGGQQFALPEAIDVLRADRRRAARDPSADPPLRVAAADPLNLVGIVTPGSRVSALSGLTVDVLAGGASEP